MKPRRYPYSGRVKTPASVVAREWIQQVKKQNAESKKKSLEIEKRLKEVSEKLSSLIQKSVH